MAQPCFKNCGSGRGAVGVKNFPATGSHPE